MEREEKEDWEEEEGGRRRREEGGVEDERRMKGRGERGGGGRGHCYAPHPPPKMGNKRKGSQERVRKNLLLFSSFQEFLPGFLKGSQPL